MKRLNNNFNLDKWALQARLHVTLVPAICEKVDAVVRFEPKKMVKEEMTGGNREQGRKKSNFKFSLGRLAQGKNKCFVKMDSKGHTFNSEARNFSCTIHNWF